MHGLSLCGGWQDGGDLDASEDELEDEVSQQDRVGAVRSLYCR